MPLSFLPAILVFLLLAPIALAQNTILREQVVDQLSAVIQNARITLTGQDGKERRAKSDTTGEFSIPNLPPGSYKLTAAFKGFLTYIEQEVKALFADSLLKIALTAPTINCNYGTCKGAFVVKPLSMERG
jgi:Carboxypeptidase regulatory-like domain